MQIDLSLDDLSHLLNTLAPQVVRGVDAPVMDLFLRLNEAFYQLQQQEEAAMPAGKKSYMSPHIPETPTPETKQTGGAGQGDTATKTPMRMPPKQYSTSAHIPDTQPPEMAIKGSK